MTPVHLQAIGTATPAHDVHAPFVAYARTLLGKPRERALFDRMADLSGIEHRYANFTPGRLADGEIDAEGFYRRNDFPGTAARMQRYERDALPLALAAVRALGDPARRARTTHLVVASCTGFYAPGLDVALADALGLDAGVQRTLIGFMGCSAALPALRCAWQTVRAEPAAQVLVVNVELSSLHLHETSDIEELLSFVLFGDGASAAFVGAEPRGCELLDFRTRTLPAATRDLITWRIGDDGFRMHLSGRVPGQLLAALAAERERPDAAGTLRGLAPSEIDLWAVHAGGRSVLDAVQQGLGLAPSALAASRAVLRDAGNMSSATVMFVLERLLADPAPGAAGLALAFGPGMTAESMRFRCP